MLHPYLYTSNNLGLSNVLKRFLRFKFFKSKLYSIEEYFMLLTYTGNILVLFYFINSNMKITLFYIDIDSLFLCNIDSVLITSLKILFIFKQYLFKLSK